MTRSSLHIVADDAIPYAREAFEPLGELQLLPGREITPERVRSADVLLVRSRTRVDERLLAGSRVRFVGSTVAGLDHVDQTYLARAGIRFYSAQGCNANSVSEYVTAALVTLAAEQGFSLRGRRIAVIGVGHVGSRVAAKAKALGMEPLLNDPPRAEREPGFPHVPLAECLEADIVTLHTPLTDHGAHPTRHLLDANRVRALGADTILVNAARGGIVDETAWAGQPLRASVVDCWKNEPDIDPALLARADIATPHIAGHSLDAKVNGTRMALDALCRFLGADCDLDLEQLMPAPSPERIELDAHDMDETRALHQIIRQAYPIRQDDAALRQDIDRLSGYFEDLRRNYPVRREWPHHQVAVTGADESLRATLAGLGFALASR